MGFSIANFSSPMVALLDNSRKINFKVYNFYSKFETPNSLWDLTLEISTLQWSPLPRIAKKKYFFKFKIFRNLRIRNYSWDLAMRIFTIQWSPILRISIKN